MRKLVQRFFQTLSAATYAIADVSVLSWSGFLANQPECPEEICK